MSEPWFPIPGTGLASAESLRVFYQSVNGNINQAENEGGLWPISYLSPKPVFNSPLASVNAGKAIHVFYLDENYIIQEYIFSGGNSIQGTIGKLKIKAYPDAGLAAIAYGLFAGAVPPGGGPGPVVTGNIRVYYQDFEKLEVKELTFAGFGSKPGWSAGDLSIVGALAGTGLAAVVYYFENQTQIRVYYQFGDLSLKEYAHNGSGWFEGAFNPGKATPQTPLGAIAFGAVELQVYWRDLSGHIVIATNTGEWNPPAPITPIGPGYKFALLREEKRTALFYQQFDDAVVIFYSDDDGKTWYGGSTVVGGPTL